MVTKVLPKSWIELETISHKETPDLTTLSFDFSTKDRIEKTWLTALPSLCPNLRELNLEGCQCIEKEGLFLREFSRLESVKLTGSNLSLEQTLKCLFDHEGHSSVRIEQYDSARNIGILGRAMQLAKLFKGLTSRSMQAECERSWNIVYDLTKSHSWTTQELRNLLIQNFAAQDPYIQQWREIAATVLPSEMIPITLRVPLPLPLSNPPGLYRFIGMKDRL
jgi:hypothetical protein